MSPGLWPNRLFFHFARVSLCLSLTQSMAQLTRNPACFEYENADIKIDAVELTRENTIISLTFKNRERNDVYINIAPFTEIKEKHSTKSYSILRFENIEVSPKTTLVRKNKSHSFKLFFPRVSAGCTTIDLFTCPEENCFNVKGIKIKNNHKAALYLDTSKKFQREYDFVAIYDKKKKKWGDWQRGRYLIVFNINEDYDFRLYLESKIISFRILKSPERKKEDGKEFQFIQGKDSQGYMMYLKLYNDGDALLFYPEGEAYQFTSL